MFYLEEFKKKFIELHDRILENLNKFKFKKVEIISPLKLEFIQTQNIWKIHLLEVFYAINMRDKKYIRVRDMIMIFNYPRMSAMMILNRLTKRGYLKKFSLTPSSVGYNLTDIGLTKAIKLSQDYEQKAIEIKNIVKSSFNN